MSKTTLIFTILATFLVAGVTLTIISYIKAHPCLKSHTELVHHSAWTQFILVGKVTTPIFHPAYSANEKICDLRK